MEWSSTEQKIAFKRWDPEVGGNDVSPGHQDPEQGNTVRKGSSTCWRLLVGEERGGGSWATPGENIAERVKGGRTRKMKIPSVRTSICDCQLDQSFVQLR